MTFTEFTQSNAYKQIMQKVTGLGASVVLIGALFKIQHYPGASFMLILGLCTEALIFFVTAFDPLPEELDWTLVFPELAGVDDIDESVQAPKKNGKGGAVSGGSQSALEKFDDMIAKAEIGPDMFEKLGKGLNNLNSTVANINDLTNATVATEKYVKSVSSAASTVDGLSGAFSKSADAISKTSEIVASSGNSYQQLLEGLNKNLTSVGQNSKAQAEQQDLLTKNLSALNAVYEMQLKNSNANLEANEKLSGDMTKIMEDLKSTANDVAKYKEEVSKLSKNLASLNTVYGNMLAAMNIK